MNERFKELADKSYVTVITTRGHEGIKDGCYVVSPDRLQQFAELLVKECRNTVAENFHECKTASEMDKIIKEHFGVE